jgi:hypothetical protein
MTPETLWEHLLSEDAARIRRIWQDLTDDECAAVLAHLRRMTTEPDWQPAQQQSAAAALAIIQEYVQRF